MQESDHVAPIIPLFGAAKQPATRADAFSDDAVGDNPPEDDAVEDDAVGAPSSPAVVSDASLPAERKAADGGWRSTWAAPTGTTRSGRSAADAVGRDHPAGGAPGRRPVRLRALKGPGDEQSSAENVLDVETVRQAAEALLVRKLRSRSLSESEARAILRGFDLEGHRLPGEGIDDVIDDFCRRGYLDDATLASLLVTSGVERKGQGRTALARLMAQRGIPRETIDAALEDVPDDDYERALEFARSKMRSLGRFDAETAKRRLSGQLARRGYPGGVVSSVLRAVVAENYSARPSSGVRFE
ncbi:regulatory protein RecX [Microbacterium sp. ZW T5_45]|uniref:regulatory protein RecX n=1 Tax=Microbacterium sp. ZW T5_45 TaxID=3378080 RepID=UPI003854DF58